MIRLHLNIFDKNTRGSAVCILLYHISSIQLLSRVLLFVTPWTAAHQASLSIANPGVYSNSCSLTWGCHPTISSSVVPFFSGLQSCPASESFPMSQFFASDGQSIGAWLQHHSFQWILRIDFFFLGLTDLILQLKGFSRIFSNTIVRKHSSLNFDYSSPLTCCIIFFQIIKSCSESYMGFYKYVYVEF